MGWMAHRPGSSHTLSLVENVSNDHAGHRFLLKSQC